MEKRYNDLNTYLQNLFGCRVQKISIDAGLTCPNRDGTLSTGGCINGLSSGFDLHALRAEQFQEPGRCASPSGETARDDDRF